MTKRERERQAREAKRMKEEEELTQRLKMLVSNSKEPSRADMIRQVLNLQKHLTIMRLKRGGANEQLDPWASDFSKAMRKVQAG